MQIKEKDFAHPYPKMYGKAAEQKTGYCKLNHLDCKMSAFSLFVVSQILRHITC